MEKIKVNKVKPDGLDVSMFWDIKRTLTHNTLINVIVGNRGGGKSFGFKEWAIDDFLENKIRCGHRLDNTFSIEDKVIFKNKNNQLLGIYQVEGEHLKVWKNFI